MEPIETVRQFCAAASGSRESLRQALRDYFTVETEWINVGLAKTIGIEEAVGLCDQLEQSMGISAIDIEILAIAADGNKVLTERVDAMIDQAGEITHRDVLMGIFEISDGKIIAWRDYFDSAAALSRAE